MKAAKYILPNKFFAIGEAQVTGRPLSLLLFSVACSVYWRVVVRCIVPLMYKSGQVDILVDLSDKHLFHACPEISGDSL